MGCDKGLVRIDRETGAAHFMNTSFDNMTDNSIFSIARDHEGAFWIGTYFGGVNYFSPVVNTFSYYYTTLERSFKKSNISSFAEGEGQQIWVGSYDNGLSLFNAETKQFEPVRADIGYHNIQELYYDDGYLYISQYGQGIKVLDTRTGRITELAKLPGAHDISRFVTTIFKSSKGLYFFASEESVSQYDPVRKTARYIDDLDLMFVKDIMEDYNGAIWFATHSYGLRRLNADDTWEPLPAGGKGWGFAPGGQRQLFVPGCPLPHMGRYRKPGGCCCTTPRRIASNKYSRRAMACPPTWCTPSRTMRKATCGWRPNGG